MNNGTSLLDYCCLNNCLNSRYFAWLKVCYTSVGHSSIQSRLNSCSFSLNPRKSYPSSVCSAFLFWQHAIVRLCVFYGPARRCSINWYPFPGTRSQTSCRSGWRRRRALWPWRRLGSNESGQTRLRSMGAGRSTSERLSRNYYSHHRPAGSRYPCRWAGVHCRKARNWLLISAGHLARTRVTWFCQACYLKSCKRERRPRASEKIQTAHYRWRGVFASCTWFFLSLRTGCWGRTDYYVGAVCARSFRAVYRTTSIAALTRNLN